MDRGGCAMSVPGLHFTDVGSKTDPTIVLLHSLATHSELWAQQVPVWATHFRVIRVDLPGHGQSAVADEALSLADMAKAVLAVLDTLQVSKAAFVGVSLGGMVAQAIALAHGARVAALVIAHAGARTDAAVRAIWEQRIQQFEDGGLAHLTQPTLERWFPRSFAESSPMTMDWVAGLIQATDPKGYVNAIRAIQGLDHLDRLPNITAPTLVIAGLADAAVPSTVASLVAQRIPNAQLHLLEETGHIGNVQKPTEFTEMVGQFLATAMKPDNTKKRLETTK